MDVAHALGRLLGTPCTIVPVVRIAESAAAAQALLPPAKEIGQRWTPGVVFHVNGLYDSIASTTPRSSHGSEIGGIPAGRLDKRRRGGGWGAVSSAVGRQLGGVWTARSASTLEGVLMRLEEIPSA